MKKLIALLVVIMALLLVFSACEDTDDKGSDSASTEKIADRIDISALDLSLYINLGEYKGIEITLAEGDSRGDAVWSLVLNNSQVIQYPEQQVKYYFERSKASYEYLAKKGNDTYEHVISELGITEEQMLDEARELVKADLVLHALIKAESIELTEDDKQNNFERYVQKFVKDYGYSEEYVRENMAEQIYDTMLFDKTVEKLMTLNTFVDTQEN